MRYFMLFVFLPLMTSLTKFLHNASTRNCKKTVGGSGKSGTLDLVLGKFSYMFRFLYVGNDCCQ